MKKEPERCPHCGAKMAEYPITLRKGIVRALVKWAKAYGLEYGEKADVNLSRGEYSNWAHLRYWGLIQRPKGDGRGGRWRCTQKGLDFLTGRISLPKKVWTWRNEVVREEGPATWVGDVTDGWKYRPDYAREALPHPEPPDQGGLF